MYVIVDILDEIFKSSEFWRTQNIFTTCKTKGSNSTRFKQLDIPVHIVMRPYYWFYLHQLLYWWYTCTCQKLRPSLCEDEEIFQRGISRNNFVYQGIQVLFWVTLLCIFYNFHFVNSWERTSTPHPLVDPRVSFIAK